MIKKPRAIAAEELKLGAPQPVTAPVTDTMEALKASLSSCL
jgi:hypothetical protein